MTLGRINSYISIWRRVARDGIAGSSIWTALFQQLIQLVADSARLDDGDYVQRERDTKISAPADASCLLARKSGMDDDT